MRHNDVRTQQLNRPPRTPTRVPVFDGARWRRLFLRVAYVLVAGPLGLCYLSLLAVALTLDLVLLLVHVLIVSSLVLGYSATRGVLWLLRFGLRFVWVSTLAMLVWMVRTLAWLLFFTGAAVIRLVSVVIVKLIHPRTAWRRAVTSMRGERERARESRRAQAAPAPAVPIRIRRQGDRFLEVSAAGLDRLQRRVVPRRWIFVPALWWHLARFERGHTMRWLAVDLAPLGPAHHLPGIGLAVAPPHLAATSLVYLLAKLPLGAAAIAIIVLAVAIWTWLFHRHDPSGLLVVLLGAVYPLHLLAVASGRVAQRAFSPSAAMRRLMEAEAVAAEERIRAERSEQSRRDLIVNVSHELRTPTASILGHIESLLLALDAHDRQIDPETLRTYLAIVQREAERLGTLVGELLSIARSETDSLQLVIAPVDAAGVVKEVYQALAPLARHERQVKLVYTVEPDLPPVLADRQRLAQVLLNLVRNAITYTPAGGIVSVTLSPTADNHLLFSVADTGSGIAPEDLERVFERFFRTDASRARSSGGFGLGLAIVRELVEAMHGEVTVESTPGEGSCFHVWLPSAVRPTVAPL